MSTSALPSISEYTLLEFLGEGSTAQVYLAKHEASGAHVAIKVIDKLLIKRSQLESKIQQEMVLHAELQHLHVLCVQSVFEDARNYYMVLEYCARRSLSALVKTLPSRQLDEQSVKKIFRQVVSGVVYLHANGVIHRDLKLANLLMNEDGDIKISDFGLAGRLGEEHTTMCGTPNFIAPEVLTADNEPYTEAVDVWSLGCILYCLLLGKPPFEGRKVSETLENVANARQTPLVFPQGFSSSASDLIKRLLSPNPQNRPSAQQILLHPWLRDQSQKRVPSQSSGRRKSLAHRLPQPRASSEPPERVRKSRVHQSVLKESVSEASSSFPVSVKARRRRTLGDTRGDSKQHGLLVNGTRFRSMPATAGSSSSDSSEDFDVDSVELDESSDLSELSLSTLSCHDKQKQEKEITEQAEESLDEVSQKSKVDVSVILHLEVEDETLFGIFHGDREKNKTDGKLQLQWSCKESTEIGRSPTFMLKISNGWDVCYDPAIAVVTATTPEGHTLRFEITKVGAARRDSNASSHTTSSRHTHGMLFPPLVRLCQCLALRTMQLRQIALRGNVSKLPYIHYDTLPSSLVASFRYRCSLLNDGFRCLNQGMPVEHVTTQRKVDIAGVGCGYIDESGDLRVVYLDGAQLVLAASGLQLRFRPPWSTNAGDEADVKEDVFDLLTNGKLSSYLPSAVKQKLESIPEFIRRLKAPS